MACYSEQPNTLVEEAASELSSLFSSNSSPESIPLVSITSDDSSQESSSDDEALSSPSPVPMTKSDLRQLTGVQHQEAWITQGIDPVREFPLSCLKLVRSLPGNNRCIDCGSANPQWASISYGVVLCLNCSGRHRSLGVSVSKVRSMLMDSWSHSQILSMLEGGNTQLSQFFERHSLGQDDSDRPEDDTMTGSFVKLNITDDDIVAKRYKTKAAKFYRENLVKHVEKVMNNGEYQGREASRRIRSHKRSSSST